MEKDIKKLNFNVKKIIEILAIIGILISLYLTYVKLSSDPFVCGFGDCGQVQNSKYGDIMGIPVAVLGIIYYFTLFIFNRELSKKYMNIWIAWGVLFSTYLTYIELFVIEAICGWCVVSFINILVIALVRNLKWKST